MNIVSPQSKPVVCFVIGTRPEAIKVAPIILAMRAEGRMQPWLVNTAQQAHIVEQALQAFGVVADSTVALQRTTGSMAELTSRLLPPLDALLAEIQPAAVVVQGDTSTAMIGALAAFWRQVPVVHVEAGLRSGRLDSPFPEEANRRIVDHISSLHLAPTEMSQANLAREGLAGDHVLVTGNTSVDAIRMMASASTPFADPALEEIAASGRDLVLVTCHRRESWGEPLQDILSAVREVVERHPRAQVVFPVHPNPLVHDAVHAALGGVDRVHLCAPLSYPELARLLSISTLVLSDSGGIQEEAPTFGVPVLVLREVTERMEAVEAGVARLVGTDPAVIVAEASRLLEDPAARLGMVASQNPFGDGTAARQTVEGIASLLALDTPVVFAPVMVGA